MKDIKESKVKLRKLSQTTTAIGISILVVFCLAICICAIQLFTAQRQSLSTISMTIGWVSLAITGTIAYIDYRILKLKIEMTEQSQDNETGKQITSESTR